MSTAPERRMTDIHMHLIPGVDDGAETMEMALEMMCSARQQGISQIIATPHSNAFHRTGNDVRRLLRQLKKAASAACPDMKLALGCEVFCNPGSMDQVLKALKSGRYPTMNGTRYVLTEFSQWVWPEDTIICLEALTKAGYKPIIAHMERYHNLRGNMNLADRFRELGALIQVNAYSLFDEADHSIRHWARQLVLARKADFLGTDAHRTWHRPPCVENGIHWLYENTDREYAEALAWKNAQLFLEGADCAGKNWWKRAMEFCLHRMA